MNSKLRIPSKLLWVICISFVIALSGCTRTPDLPGVDELTDELFYLIQKKTVDYGRGQQRLSDIYKLLRFEKMGDLEKGKRSRRIKFTGDIELRETVYNYGRYGYRTHMLSSKLGFLSCKGKVDKGTVISFNGSVDYELTKKGWRQNGYAVSMDSEHVPEF